MFRIFSNKEAGLFIIFLAFVLILSLAAFKVTDFLHQDLEQTLAQEITKERLLNEQIRVLGVRRLLIRDIALAQDPFDRDDKIQEHSANAAVYMKVRDQLLHMELSAVEKNIFDEQIDLNRQGYKAQMDFIDRLIDDDVEDPGDEILNNIEPVLKTINDRVMGLRELLISASDATRKRAREQYESGWVWVLLLYISSLVFTGALTFWIYYRQKSHQSDLEYQATHDALTGLTNRAEFERQLQIALEESGRSHSHNVMLYMDLDQFKVVNDTSGHIAGDELLMEISQQMRRCIRGSDLLSRLGGDEFGVLLWECDEDKAIQIAEKIRNAVANFRFVWSKREFTVGVSIGLVVLNDFYQDITEALSAVDVACYPAKDLGRNRVHVYTEDDTETSNRHGELHSVSQIRNAINNNQFRLYFQEIFPVGADNQSKKIELLLRMERGEELVKPDSFIPAAERYSLMPLVDRWVIQQVINMLSAGETDYLQGADIICINISGLSIAEPSFLSFITDAMDENKLDGKRLCFEITESAVIAKLNQAVDFISSLRERGCTFALDDFGKGLSSYNYLKQLPVDYLKIDGSFVQEMQTDSADYVFVQSINTVGKALGLKTIAEWVESEDVLAQLKALGVDYAQGNYLGEVKSCLCKDTELTLPGA